MGICRFQSSKTTYPHNLDRSLNGRQSPPVGGRRRSYFTLPLSTQWAPMAHTLPLHAAAAARNLATYVRVRVSAAAAQSAHPADPVPRVNRWSPPTADSSVCPAALVWRVAGHTRRPNSRQLGAANSSAAAAATASSRQQEAPSRQAVVTGRHA
jgi:hypothetical protein